MPSVIELINGIFIFAAGLAHALPQPNPVAAYPPSECVSPSPRTKKISKKPPHKPCDIMLTRPSIDPIGLISVNLRIEGDINTIYKAPIYSSPLNITTASGGTHPCDGTNLNANPTAGNTCTDALDAASKFREFPYDGTYDLEFDDFLITSISTSTQTATEFWCLLLNYQFTPVGGCQQEVKINDQVLWAYDAFNKVYFLKVTPNKLVVKEGSSHVVTVTDGRTGVAVPGAVIDGVTTDAKGNAVWTFPEVGVFEYKATRDDSLRSNALYVAVA